MGQQLKYQPVRLLYFLFISACCEQEKRLLPVCATANPVLSRNTLQCKKGILADYRGHDSQNTRTSCRLCPCSEPLVSDDRPPHFPSAKPFCAPDDRKNDCTYQKKPRNGWSMTFDRLDMQQRADFVLGAPVEPRAKGISSARS